jgi:hypothetical protein
MEDTLVRTLVQEIHMGKRAQSRFKYEAWTAVARAVNQALRKGGKPLPVVLENHDRVRH